MTVVDKKISVPVTVSDVQSVLQTSESTVSALCKNVNINKWSKNKPVRHSTISNITDAQRQSVNFGLLMKDLEGIRKNWIRADDGSGSGTAFDSESPTKWEYLTPRGTSVSPTEWNRLLDFDGYNHNANPPLSIIDTKYSAGINDKVFNINGKISSDSSTNFGNPVNVEIMISELNVESSFPVIDQDAYRNILGGNWRLGLAIQVPQSSNTYRYLILSTISPLEVYDTTNITEFNKHNLDMSESSFQSRLKIIVRGWGVNNFKCIPFLGCDLKYKAEWGWYWGGTTMEKAITFPMADTFNLSTTGFATNIVSSLSSISIAVNDTTLNVISGSASGAVLSLPRSIAMAATSATITIKFKLSTAFGELSNIKGGLLSSVAPKSLSGYRVNGSQSQGWVIDANAEWDGVDREYTAIILDSNLVTAIKNFATQGTVMQINRPVVIVATNTVRTSVGNDTKDILASVNILGIQFTE